jgi:hypothetical protein
LLDPLGALDSLPKPTTQVQNEPPKEKPKEVKLESNLFSNGWFFLLNILSEIRIKFKAT